MKSFAILAVVLCALSMLAPVAVADAGGMGVPAVSVAKHGDSLVLTFPADTLQYTVGLRAHGMVLDHKVISRNHKAITWTSPTELTIDLKAFHHRHHKGHKGEAMEREEHEGQPVEIWVWGQLKNGDALIQKQMCQR